MLTAAAESNAPVKWENLTILIDKDFITAYKNPRSLTIFILSHNNYSHNSYHASKDLDVFVR